MESCYNFFQTTSVEVRLKCQSVGLKYIYSGVVSIVIRGGGHNMYLGSCLCAPDAPPIPGGSRDHTWMILSNGVI